MYCEKKEPKVRESNNIIIHSQKFFQSRFGNECVNMLRQYQLHEFVYENENVKSHELSEIQVNNLFSSVDYQVMKLTLKVLNVS
jgi:hypothetical protein